MTGAGGSIGSELCRQIIRLQPAQLVLFEIAELALYAIERELQMLSATRPRRRARRRCSASRSTSAAMREIMQIYDVHTVYHAAAYKHVPIVEQNVVEGIHNNVFGTWNTAEAALECASRPSC